MSMDITQIKVKPIDWYETRTNVWAGDFYEENPTYSISFGVEYHAKFCGGLYQPYLTHLIGVASLEEAKKICQQHKESRAKELMGLVELIPAPKGPTPISNQAMKEAGAIWVPRESAQYLKYWRFMGWRVWLTEDCTVYGICQAHEWMFYPESPIYTVEGLADFIDSQAKV